MPFICLANANVPGGVLQITDLWPNVSQHNNPTYPPGQTRYLRRPGTDTTFLSEGLVVGTAYQDSFEGLAAYLADRVAPGAFTTMMLHLNMNAGTVVATDQVVLKGVYFEFAAGANDLVHAGTVADPLIVGLGAGDVDRDNNFVAAVNAAGTQALFLARENTGFYLTAVPLGGGGFTIRSETGTGFFRGAGSYFSSSTSTVEIALADTRVNTLTFGEVAWAPVEWTATTITATVAALLARVDAGLGMAIGDVNTVLRAQILSDLATSAVTGCNSTGTLPELLSILAGRSYQLPKGAAKGTSFVAGTDTIYYWLPTQRGSFTVPNATWDTDMLGGEWGATAAGQKYLKTGGRNSKPTFSGGGDVVNNEIGGARTTVHGTAFAASVANGQLFRYANGVTLFPDADVQAHIAPSLLSKQTRQPTLLNQRVVTVYDDDGTVLV